MNESGTYIRLTLFYRGKQLKAIPWSEMDPNFNNYSPDPLALENDGKTFAMQAVNYDKSENYSTAIFYYNVSLTG